MARGARSGGHAGGLLRHAAVLAYLEALKAEQNALSAALSAVW